MITKLQEPDEEDFIYWYPSNVPCVKHGSALSNEDSFTCTSCKIEAAKSVIFSNRPKSSERALKTYFKLLQL